MEMEVHEYSELDACGLATAIRQRQVDRNEVLVAAIAAIQAVDASVNALAAPLFEQPLGANSRGTFSGVPMLLKDAGVTVEGVPITMGSRLAETLVGTYDCDLVRQFKGTGLTILGRTAVPELAMHFTTESVRTGPTLNPWELTVSTGGSSGGAAALVAAGAVPVAHGADAGGSIRQPAACCGVVGLKPSVGRIPQGPPDDEALFGLDSSFVLVRTVRDVAFLLDALQRRSPGARHAAELAREPFAATFNRDPGSLNIAWAERCGPPAPDPECAAAVVDAAQTLEGLGHRVVRAVPPVDWEELGDAIVTLWTVAVAHYVRTLVAATGKRGDDGALDAPTRVLASAGERVSVSEVFAALECLSRARRRIGEFFEAHDVLVLPANPRLGVPIGATVRLHDETSPAEITAGWRDYEGLYAFNVSGGPAISLPLASSSGGLPIGIQFAADLGREDTLLQLAAQLESAMPWSGRKPPVHAGATPVT
jgi:amidase